ncbi:MAG: MBL fold metallo-hydrolase, partial [Chloroflexota bacterium]
MDPSNSVHYVDTRRIGDATVSIIRDGTFPWAPELQVAEDEWRRAMPEADPAGQLPIDVNLAHVRIGDNSIVIDLGFGDPAPSWPARLERTPGALAGLATLAVGPGDVTHVLITHAHGDHIAGATTARGGERVPTFPRARYLINRAEWVDRPAGEHPSPVQA